MSTDGDDQQTGGQWCNLPDNIIGIGHAGKTTVTHYLSQDWILREGVEKREGETPDREFKAFVIDTATNEQTEDELRIRRINERIDEIAERSGRPPDTVEAGIEYINPLDYAPDNLISRAGLTSNATVNQIARSDTLRAWWLENQDSMLTDGYGQGVLRRRGLSKALLHASQAGGGEMEMLPRRIEGDTATMVVGLGGGTGSGMFLDLAKQISEEVDEVHLVATIPGLREKDRRTANAFAALSELEYLALNEENPFTNIVLVPFGPARDLQNRDTFLDALVQTIVAREATTNNFSSFLDESAPNPNPKAYAPFTVAVPQILRYDVGDIIETANAIESYREQKRSALDSELALYNALHDFFIDEWGGEIGRALETAQKGRSVDNEQFSLSGDEASSLRNRLDDLQSWIEDEESFGHVDNKALDNWRDQLDGWIEGLRDKYADLSDEEFKKRLVTRLPDRVDRLQPVDDLYPAETEQRKLAEVFRDELRAIKLRSNLFRALKIVDEDEVREALTAAIYTDRDGWVGGQSLGDHVNQLEQQIQRYETNEELLDDLEAELADARDHHAESWRDAAADDVDLLVELQTHGDAIEAELDELERSLDDVFATISNANGPDEIPANIFSFDFDRLNERLRKVGLAPVDKTAINETVEKTTRAYEAWYEINNSSFFGDILGKKEETKNEYVAYLDEVDPQYVTIHPTAERGNFDRDFECELAGENLFGDIIADLETKRKRTLGRVVKQFEQTVSDFDAAEVVEGYRAQWVGDDFDLSWPGDTDDASGDLRTFLSTDLEARSAEEVFEELLADGSGFEDPGIVYVGLDDALLGPVAEKRSQLDDRAQDTEERVDVYETLRQIVLDYDDSFSDTGPVRPEMNDAPTYVSNSDSPYIKKTKSVDRAGLRQYEDIADSRIWEKPGSQEMQKIQSHFERFANNVVQNNELVSLEERKIEVATDAGGEYTDVRNPVYDGHYIGNVYLSRAFRTQQNPGHPVFKSVKRAFDDSSLYFKNGANGYSHESVGHGAPWDLSMVTFIGGVFLDNIRPILQPSRGYKNSYESQREELREAVRIRHVHGVDGKDETLGDDGEGGYVYRDSLLNLNDPDDLYTLLDATEEEMVEILLDQYVGQTTFPSSIDLSSDE
ncbi:hypothetical protein DVK02_10690 [Halobellus sp. Atlit-31R]|nr:hypothetical protein DVK02_10690 [Halobellus sp. Atlit-31R]